MRGGAGAFAGKHGDQALVVFGARRAACRSQVAGAPVHDVVLVRRTRAYDWIHRQILSMADMLSDGIAAQFPKRFR